MATKSDKIWADAVRKAVHEYGQAKDENGKAKKIRYINVLAAQLVKAGINGDIQAIKEIGDRLDGKSRQAIDQTHDLSDPVKELLEHTAKHGRWSGPEA